MSALIFREELSPGEWEEGRKEGYYWLDWSASAQEFLTQHDRVWIQLELAQMHLISAVLHSFGRSVAQAFYREFVS